MSIAGAFPFPARTWPGCPRAACIVFAWLCTVLHPRALPRCCVCCCCGPGCWLCQGPHLRFCCDAQCPVVPETLCRCVVCHPVLDRALCSSCLCSRACWSGSCARRCGCSLGVAWRSGPACSTLRVTFGQQGLWRLHPSCMGLPRQAPFWVLSSMASHVLLWACAVWGLFYVSLCSACLSLGPFRCADYAPEWHCALGCTVCCGRVSVLQIAL